MYINFSEDKKKKIRKKKQKTWSEKTIEEKYIIAEKQKNIGEKNGMSKKVKTYDANGNFFKEFCTMRECLDFFENNFKCSSRKIYTSLSENIPYTHRYNKYQEINGWRFIYCE